MSLGSQDLKIFWSHIRSYEYVSCLIIIISQHVLSMNILKKYRIFDSVWFWIDRLSKNAAYRVHYLSTCFYVDLGAEIIIIKCTKSGFRI